MCGMVKSETKLIVLPFRCDCVECTTFITEPYKILTFIIYVCHHFLWQHISLKCAVWQKVACFFFPFYCIKLIWHKTVHCHRQNCLGHCYKKTDPKKAFRWLFAVFFFCFSHIYQCGIFNVSKTSTTCLWFSVDVHNAVCQYFIIHITHISKYEFEMWILTRHIWKLYLMSRYFAWSAHD